jgi:methylmalonyl-CoA mutase cobalamin-binding subunit
MRPVRRFASKRGGNRRIDAIYRDLGARVCVPGMIDPDSRAANCAENGRSTV